MEKQIELLFSFSENVNELSEEIATRACAHQLAK